MRAGEINPKGEFQFSGKGRIYSWTTVESADNAPERFAGMVPYAVALIEMEGGVKVTAMLTDIPRLSNGGLDRGYFEIGTEVEVTTRKLFEDDPKGKGMIVYGYKFRPKLKITENFDLAGCVAAAMKIMRDGENKKLEEEYLKFFQD